jgi:putative ABC transport system ATP-binding protein
MESLLSCEGLRRTYAGPAGAQRVLNGIDLTVAKGERLCILGPSGSGKTTLLYLLAGLDRPTEGSVSFAGRSYGSLSDGHLAKLRRERFGFIFQSYNLVPSMTARQNVELPLRLTSRRGAAKLAEETLARVGLAAKVQSIPGTLSGGEQQRVAIARALVTSPQIIFADEPTGNLDEQTGREVMGLIAELTGETGAACVMVTHNTDWVELCDRAIVLRDGLLEVVK